jgi:squalene-hopene/tetraprenyl-beta-curcumene cyclase
MPSIVEARSKAHVALERACEHLLSLQDEAGWWRGELQTNVTMDAEDMLLREFLSIRRPAETERSAAWIRSQQRADGTWTNFHEGPGELSTTIEAYWALRLAGDEPDAPHMRAAADFVRAHGGLERARVFTHVWLALFGLWPWERVPALPPEIVLLPSWAPLNVYDFACWARQTIVALSLVKAHSPVRALPFGLQELHGPEPWTPRRPASRRGAWLARLDRALRAYERRPLRPLRALATGRAERWIVRRQEADGSWGGIQPPWVYSLMALHLCGYPLEHPVMRRGLEGIERFMVEDRDDARGVGAPPGPSRRLEACQSPVWDTALAALALGDAGLGEEHPAMARAAQWLLDEEVTVRGDWAVARPRLQAGGWAFEFANDTYPDVDDTAEVVLALRRLRPRVRAANGFRKGAGVGALAAADGETEESAHTAVGAKTAGSAEPPDEAGLTAEIERKHRAASSNARIDAAIARAVRWVEGMQSADGGWGAFDADNTRTLVRELPFLDFGEVIDEPSADVTAHAVEMLAALGLADAPATRRGVRWLIDRQEPDGSWFGRWGVNHVYGTGAVVPALIAAGVAPGDACVRRAVHWLEVHQNEDGGWGEDPRSYDDPQWIGRGPSTASQTAWALLALHAAGERSRSLARGVDWLVSAQRPDGGWDEPQYTGTGFPSDYYINYHLYRLTFPIMALGRCLGASGGVRAAEDRVVAFPDGGGHERRE